MDAAPYQRIVAEIRERITSGRLRPGDRAPSTRQITREWGVAMATATKVIAELREQGLVDPKPGAGTVVRSVRRKREPDLSRDRIVRVAVEIADADGLPAVSMRRIATELGAATMSLYRHVGDKEELLHLMADTVAGEAIRREPPTPWRACLEYTLRLLWTVCRRHPWVAEALSMTRPRPMPNLMRYSEWVLAALLRTRLPTEELLLAHLNLFGHVRSLALTWQSEAWARQDTGLANDEWLDGHEAEFRRIVGTGRYPALDHLTAQETQHTLDQTFEYGLRLLLDGLERRLGCP
ncbi:MULTISPECIES: TetR/AcrR family transcriptional regulator C-terminal domain-containing protein [Amycolatopsis]|uniref:TetR/AcrR family transcriptional regulator C-terminal domain-containing protein n=1 Tax=Amycolatopsis albidoflavus TaxID=102226 RepID=A0ABW5I9H0_9PSEU